MRHSLVAAFAPKALETIQAVDAARAQALHRFVIQIAVLHSQGTLESSPESNSVKNDV